ncbi:hypothetical protein RHODGE_RHODGE_00985 [Rhodoplanes serenus]|uniref:Uncharacterized protein n=1 Tax=Rhodoplanes serenus TaxID=200615 RepID=A0A447CNA3_9BRAD|nr:hypothetical protein [Rhodoplanes serenus]VCU06621.1 hypothetical protein RHODPL_RHODPL_00069 [Rhodoplanes serenus]VCU07924.1 hypothetical protein RHODGE_RHODGE_00985 [Rhodoplanes serenus]
MSDDAVTTTLTTAEIVSRLRALPSPTRLAAAERLERLTDEIDDAQDEIADAQIEMGRLEAERDSARDEMERLTAERDALRVAIVRHRDRVWGSGPVGHDEDEALYAALAGRPEPDVVNERDADHG